MLNKDVLIPYLASERSSPSLLDGLMEHFGAHSYPLIGSRCVVIFARDNSGSMGRWETDVCMNFIHWIRLLLGRMYSYVHEEYIIHGTEAEFTDREGFRKSGGGGTIVSSAMNLGIERIDQHFATNVYFYYMSDGDNLSSDNAKVDQLMNTQILNRVQFFGYLEINQYNRSSTLMNMMRKLNASNFQYFVVRESFDNLAALEKLFLPVITPADSNEGNEHRLPLYDDWLYK